VVTTYFIGQSHFDAKMTDICAEKNVLSVFLLDFARVNKEFPDTGTSNLPDGKKTGAALGFSQNGRLSARCWRIVLM